MNMHAKPAATEAADEVEDFALEEDVAADFACYVYDKVCAHLDAKHGKDYAASRPAVVNMLMTAAMVHYATERKVTAFQIEAEQFRAELQEFIGLWQHSE